MNTEEFNKLRKKFAEEDKWGSFYDMALKLIKRGFETEAYLLILATWNSGTFKHAMKDFDINGFGETIKDINPIFQKIETQAVNSANFEEIKENIKTIYASLSKIKGVEYTGASKLMHLKNPKLFIMWDRYIRKYYGLKKTTPEKYIEFLKKMQNKFKSIKFDKKDKRTFAKAIDEYNYAKITIPILKKQRSKRKKQNENKP